MFQNVYLAGILIFTSLNCITENMTFIAVILWFIIRWEIFVRLSQPARLVPGLIRISSTAKTMREISLSLLQVYRDSREILFNEIARNNKSWTRILTQGRLLSCESRRMIIFVFVRVVSEAWHLNILFVQGKPCSKIPLVESL